MSASVAGACVICKDPIPADPKRRPGPFCSERCRTIDLGRWAEGDYRVPVVELEQDPSSNGRDDLN